MLNQTEEKFSKGPEYQGEKKIRFEEDLYSEQASNSFSNSNENLQGSGTMAPGAAQPLPQQEYLNALGIEITGYDNPVRPSSSCNSPYDSQSSPFLLHDHPPLAAPAPLPPNPYYYNFEKTKLYAVFKSLKVAELALYTRLKPSDNRIRILQRRILNSELRRGAYTSTPEVEKAEQQIKKLLEERYTEEMELYRIRIDLARTWEELDIADWEAEWDAQLAEWETDDGGEDVDGDAKSYGKALYSIMN